MTEPQRPTVAEMAVLLHWLLMFNGAVLGSLGWQKIEWFSIPARTWEVFYAPPSPSKAG